MRMLKILVDLHGVLVDFETPGKKKLGIPRLANTQIYDFYRGYMSSDEFLETIQKWPAEFWESLPWNANVANALIRTVKKFDPQWRVLSHSTSLACDCGSTRLILSRFNNDRISYVRNREDKVEKFGGRDWDVLIDDNVDNVKEFCEAGGVGILWLKPYNLLRQGECEHTASSSSELESVLEQAVNDRSPEDVPVDEALDFSVLGDSQAIAQMQAAEQVYARQDRPNGEWVSYNGSSRVGGLVAATQHPVRTPLKSSEKMVKEVDFGECVDHPRTAAQAGFAKLAEIGGVPMNIHMIDTESEENAVVGIEEVDEYLEDQEFSEDMDAISKVSEACGVTEEEAEAVLKMLRGYRDNDISADDWIYDEAAGSDEVRSVDPTSGGEKGVKPIRMDLIPTDALDELGRVFHFGTKKYAPHNYRKGYDFSKSLAALYRHLNAWNSGTEDNDPESGCSHLAHVAWHCFALMQSQVDHGDRFDDRFKPDEVR